MQIIEAICSKPFSLYTNKNVIAWIVVLSIIPIFSAPIVVRADTDHSPLKITEVRATSTTESTVTISWDTNKESDSGIYFIQKVGTTSPTSTTAIYSPATSTASSTLEGYSPNFVKHHAITISDLTTGELYTYIVTSRDKSGNVATSSKYSFKILCSEGFQCKKVIARFTMVSSGEEGSNSSNSSPIRDERFFMYYGALNSFAGMCQQPSVIPNASIGSNLPVSANFLGMYDLNSSNSPELKNLIGLMTDGKDELLNVGQVICGQDGSVLQGGASGNYESQWLNGKPDLKGEKIDFIRFIIEKNKVQEMGNTMNIDVQISVEVWEK